MKLEIDEYRTRDGRKACILAVDLPPGPGKKTAAGIVFHANGSWDPMSWNSDGFYYPDEGKSAYDLVAPWNEPLTIEGWVNVYASDLWSEIFYTRAEADKNADSGRIKCIKVTGTEVME